jgi:hypothetical protein
MESRIYGDSNIVAKDIPNPLQQTELTVSVAGETYQFKMPSVRDDARIGSIARFIRAQDDPEHIGSADGLDFNTFIAYQAFATFQVLLLRATTDWPFTAGPDGKPVINPDKFPDEAPVMEVYEGYLDALATFRKGPAGAEGQPEPTVVDGQSNPEAEPVQ